MEVAKVGFKDCYRQNFGSENLTNKNLLKQDAQRDSFEGINNKAEPPKISRLRLAFGFLTEDQVKGINEAGKLPDNAKFVMNNVGNGYTICNNFFGWRAGTKELPVGFEVKRNVFGFAIVVPKGTEGALVK